MRTFIDLLEQHGVRFKRHGESSKVTEGWVGMPCPFCHHTSQNGDPNLLGINLRTGRISCWYCGSHPPGMTLARLTGMPLKDAIELTSGMTAEVVLPEAPVGKYDPPAHDPLVRGIQHRDYLRRRGFNPKTLDRLWHVGSIGWHGTYSWRLFIPILVNGHPVSWTTRSISPEARVRYMGAPAAREAVPAKQLLYGEDYARSSIVVVEGPFDAWAIGPGAVAVMGTGVSMAQVRRIAAYPVRAICFDNEPIAQQRARKLAEMLAGLPGDTRIIRLQTGADPASATAEEIQHVRKTFLEDQSWTTNPNETPGPNNGSATAPTTISRQPATSPTNTNSGGNA